MIAPGEANQEHGPRCRKEHLVGDLMAGAVDPIEHDGAARRDDMARVRVGLDQATGEREVGRCGPEKAIRIDGCAALGMERAPAIPIVLARRDHFRVIAIWRDSVIVGRDPGMVDGGTAKERGQSPSVKS
jgi:hypothetical protein